MLLLVKLNVVFFPLHWDNICKNVCFLLHQDNIYLLDRGQNINKRPNIVYIKISSESTDWMALHQFVDVSLFSFFLVGVFA